MDHNTDYIQMNTDYCRTRVAVKCVLHSQPQITPVCLLSYSCCFVWTAHHCICYAIYSRWVSNM